MAFTVEVWGDYACFTRPELKVERVSYDIITPSAARGIIQAVFWKPEIRYIIDEIKVINEIQFDNIRRNEVNSKASKNQPYIVATEDRAQRAATVLKDVRYIITAHFEMTGKATEPDATPKKYFDIIERRFKKGKCFHTPYFGTREFPAKFKWVEADEKQPEAIPLTQDFGLMMYDFKFSEKDEAYSAEPMFFRAKMVNGVVDLRNVEVLK